jgi:hypothetical protein
MFACPNKPTKHTGPCLFPSSFDEHCANEFSKLHVDEQEPMFPSTLKNLKNFFLDIRVNQKKYKLYYLTLII